MVFSLECAFDGESCHEFLVESEFPAQADLKVRREGVSLLVVALAMTRLRRHPDTGLHHRNHGFDGGDIGGGMLAAAVSIVHGIALSVSADDSERAAGQVFGILPRSPASGDELVNFNLGGGIAKPDDFAADVNRPGVFAESVRRFDLH